LRRLDASTVYLPAPGAGSDAAEDDLDFLVHVLDPRRTRVIPDGLLSLTWFYSPAAHEVLLVFDLLRLYGP
jgi:hypothetical protein